MDPENNNLNAMPNLGPTPTPSPDAPAASPAPAPSPAPEADNPVTVMPATSPEPSPQPITDPAAPIPTEPAPSPAIETTPAAEPTSAPIDTTEPAPASSPAESEPTEPVEDNLGVKPAFTNEIPDNSEISFGAAAKSPDELTKEGINESNADKPAILTEEGASIEPAAPVPGSIGSSASFGAKPKKATSKTTIILAVLILLVLAIGGGAAYYFLSMKPASDSTSRSAAPAPTVQQPVKSTLTCTLETKPDQTSNTDATKATATKHQIIANYEDKRLVDFADKYEATYATSAAALTALDGAKTSYAEIMKNLELESDPFTTEMNRKDATITVSHIAAADKLTDKNAALIGLPVNPANRKVVADATSITKIFKDKKYTCNND